MSDHGAPTFHLHRKAKRKTGPPAGVPAHLRHQSFDMDCDAVREEIKAFAENSTWMMQAHPKPLAPSVLRGELRRLERILKYTDEVLMLND